MPAGGSAVFRLVPQPSLHAPLFFRKSFFFSQEGHQLVERQQTPGHFQHKKRDALQSDGIKGQQCTAGNVEQTVKNGLRAQPIQQVEKECRQQQYQPRSPDDRDHDVPSFLISPDLCKGNKFYYLRRVTFKPQTQPPGCLKLQTSAQRTSNFKLSYLKRLRSKSQTFKPNYPIPFLTRSHLKCRKFPDQRIRRALPIISSSGTTPHHRESVELWRLSPIMK